MKALCVRQPFASAIARGEKTIEIRSWSTPYRGDVLILASASPRVDSLPTGCTICVVHLDDCRLAQDDTDAERALCDVYADDYCWILSNPRPLPAIPTKGRLGLFTVPDPLASQVAAHLFC
jgi:hypothetical protein